MTNVRVHVISTGGTISMVPTKAGLLPSLGAHDLIGSELHGEVSVSFDAHQPLPGASLRSESISAVIDAARAAVDQGAAGVVVTQGTDNLEETAFLMELVWDRDEPLIVTGAMRAATAPGSDGQGNLVSSIQVALDPDARCRGVMAVMGDEVFSATSVAKIHSSRVAAFASPGVGRLATIGEQRPHWVSAPKRASLSRFPVIASPSQVTTVTIQFDQSVNIFDWAQNSDSVEGVVIAAMGVGHVPSWCMEPLAALSAAKPVVYVTRTGSGSVFTSSYGFPGSERDLIEQGLLPGGSLSAHKARLLLAQCLNSANSQAVAKELFSSWVNALSGLTQV